MNDKGSSIKSLTVTAIMAAIICVVGPITIPIPFGPVPISLATLVMFLSVYVLGTRRALAAAALYLLIGAIGVPVLSGFSGGIARFAGPTGGYLIGYLPMVLAAGLFHYKLGDRTGRKVLCSVLGMILGTLICYSLGTAWFCISASLELRQALIACVVPFLPADAVKIACAALLGPKLRARVPEVGE